MSDQIILHANEQHDDTQALQDWFDGKTIYYANGSRVGRQINRKCLFITNTLHLNRVKFDWGKERIFTNNYVLFVGSDFIKPFYIQPSAYKPIIAGLWVDYVMQEKSFMQTCAMDCFRDPQPARFVADEFPEFIFD